MINFLFWNVRGIGSVSPVRLLRKLCWVHSVSLLFLFEPFILKDRLTLLKDSLHFLGALSISKIWVLWTNNLHVSLPAQTEQFLHLEVQHSLYDFLASLLVFTPNQLG